MLLFGTTLFLSAFLLFLVQPMLGKYILPWFGGSPAVWTSCMLFFQVALLAGYTYAHLVASRLRRHWQAALHLLLLFSTLLVLPIIPSEYWKPTGEQAPVPRIIGLLGASVGLPYLLLSATAPLLQAWYGRVQSAATPYRLYALSNLGSLVAILGYPFLIEPSITLGKQTRYWGWIYGVFAFFCALCAIRFLLEVPREGPILQKTEAESDKSAAPSPNRKDYGMWLGLSACGSVMLLATTNQLCQDVSVVPLLWILPLGLYLLSFILCFHSEKWYSRLFFGTAMAAAAVQTCIVLNGGVFVGLRIQLATYAATHFICCMICHGELVRIKPGREHLTSFYCLIACGGALGGAFVTIAAPRLFQGYWEYHLALLGTCLLFLVSLFRDRKGPLHHGRSSWAWSFFYLSFFALAAALLVHIKDAQSGSLATKRNFFGILRVLEDDADDPLKAKYTLMHGRIEHGFQYLNKEKRFWPTSYFGPDSGVGLAIRYHPKRTGNPHGERNLRIGIIGLGTGTLATYGEPGDTVRFYEINPDVVAFSSRYFTYRQDCAAQLEIVLGDARVSMEREKAEGLSQRYDVLAIDAFSSDAIPVHLLTRECFELYLFHLQRDGILAFHISNRYFDLKPVVARLAELDRNRPMRAVWISARGEESQGTDSTDWVLVTRNTKFLDANALKRADREWPEDSRLTAAWTDDYSNLFRLLRK